MLGARAATAFASCWPSAPRGSSQPAALALALEAYPEQPSLSAPQHPSQQGLATAAATAVAAGAARRLSRKGRVHAARAARRRTAVKAENPLNAERRIDSTDLSSLTEAKDLAKPNRKAALAASVGNKRLRGVNKTPRDVIPEDILNGKYGKEIEKALSAMTEMTHILSLGTLILEEVKDKSAVGLHGFRLEKKFVRKCSDDTETTMPAAAATVSMMKMLLEHFPDDKVLSEEDGELLAREEEFADTIVNFLTGFRIEEDATRETVVEWTRHCNSYPKDAETPLKRYWVFKPVDSKDEFRGAKQYCCSLCLMEDNEPVVSVVGCPVLAFDHASRTTTHPLGVPIFWAVKGQGSWTQLVIMQREVGVYQGKYGLKGKSLPLKVEEKIKRGNDGLYDMLGTEQLRIAQGARMRQDIFLDSERVGKILGSEFPKFHFSDSSIKFCWLARGDEDIAWSLTQGLYDKTASESLVSHAAGVHIAQESGAAVADFDGKDIDWSAGPLLKNNRGLFASDPAKVPKMGLVSALKQATETSEKEYDYRCEKRKEKARMLKAIFSDLANHAETEEERKGALKVREKGLELLENEAEMDKITQEGLNRERPLLGEGPTPDDSFDDQLPFSPVST